MSAELPTELWLHIFSFLPWRDKLSVRGTCPFFTNLLDQSPQLWRGFNIRLRQFSRYGGGFWRSLAQRHVGSVVLCSGKKKNLKMLSTRLPALHALRLDDWREGSMSDLQLFRQLQVLSITSLSVPLHNIDFLFPLRRKLTHLTLCNVQLTCQSSLLLTAISQLTCLTSLVLHHDGCLRVATMSDVLSNLSQLKHLSCTMVSYKTLSQDFFRPAHLPGGGALPLLDLQLINYDAVVTPEILEPLSGLHSLSIFHLYSVPGPVCHMTTWLTSLPQLQSLNVHGGHHLAEYADLLPSSLLSLTLCVDMLPEDLEVVSIRAPHLEHLHLEPWSSTSKLLRLLPQFFPHLRTLRIRHQSVSDEDFLSLQQLQCLHTLEVLDCFHRPDSRDMSWVVYEPSPRLRQLICELQKLTNHRVRVITRSHRDPIRCSCI